MLEFFFKMEKLYEKRGRGWRENSRASEIKFSLLISPFFPRVFFTNHSSTFSLFSRAFLKKREENSHRRKQPLNFSLLRIQAILDLMFRPCTRGGVWCDFRRFSLWFFQNFTGWAVNFLFFGVSLCKSKLHVIKNNAFHAIFYSYCFP